MSLWTLGVAVAVRAITGAGWIWSMMARIFRYSGRKSCPHSEGDVLFLGEGLRGHVQELGDTAEEVLLHFRNLVAVERGVEEMGDSVLPGLEAADGVHLVLHQGDEGGDDDGRSLHHQGRQLIAQGLAAPRGHEHERVAAGGQVPDNALLIPLEGIVTEEGLQLSVEGGGVGGHTEHAVFGL